MRGSVGESVDDVTFASRRLVWRLHVPSMDDKSPRNQPLALEPLDGPTAGGDSVRATGTESSAGAGPRGLRITTADEFLARAAQEYQEGRIDQALWGRTQPESVQIRSWWSPPICALARRHCSSKKRDERAKERLAASMRAASNPEEALQSHQEVVSTKPAGAGRLLGKPQLKYAVAGAALVTAVAIVWLVASPRDS